MSRIKRESDKNQKWVRQGSKEGQTKIKRVRVVEQEEIDLQNQINQLKSFLAEYFW